MTSKKRIENYDVIIVGAGPAGCIVASYISNDYKTLLIDKDQIPRNKSCGGLLIDSSKKFFHDQKQKIPMDIYANPRIIEKATFLDWDNTIEISLKDKIYNIERTKFDYWLWKNAIKKVDYLYNSKCIDITTDHNIKVLVKEKLDSKRIVFRTRYLVSADGAGSFVRRKFFGGKTIYAVTIQEWLKPKSFTTSIKNKVIILFWKEITSLYAWIIPKGDFFIIGCAFREKKRINERFQLLKERIKNDIKIFGDLKKREISRGVIIDTISDIELGNKNIFLVGEAAGLINPTSGEGISYALRSGYLCAKAINEKIDIDEKYKLYCNPLLELLQDQIRNSKIFYSISLRAKYLKYLNQLS